MKYTNKDFKKLRSSKFCEYCGSTEDLTIHHKQPQRNGVNNCPKNIMVLCVNCHRELHGNIKKKEDLDTKVRCNKCFRPFLPKHLNKEGYCKRCGIKIKKTESLK